MSIGFTVPFNVTTGSLGHFQVTETELEAVENDIRSILITNWGERVMHFNFGCNLREFIFQQKNSNELRGQIADRINNQMALWLPFVELNELNVLFSDDLPEIPENGIGVVMAYRLTSKPDLQGRSTFIVTT